MEQKIEIDWENVASAARKAGVPYFTSRKWKERNSIPARWWPALIEAGDGTIVVGDLMALASQDLQSPSQPEAAE